LVFPSISAYEMYTFFFVQAFGPPALEYGHPGFSTVACI